MVYATPVSSEVDNFLLKYAQGKKLMFERFLQRDELADDIFDSDNFNFGYEGYADGDKVPCVNPLGLDRVSEHADETHIAVEEILLPVGKNFALPIVSGIVDV